LEIFSTLVDHYVEYILFTLIIMGE